MANSKTDAISSLFSATSQPMMYSSPTPGWRKFDLIRSLGYPTHCPKGNFIKNMDNLINNAVQMSKDSPEAIRDKMKLCCPSSESGPITYDEMNSYTHYNLDIIGSNTLTVSPVKISVGTYMLDCSGDIGLIETSLQSSTTTVPQLYISLNDIVSRFKSSSPILVGKKGAASNSMKLGACAYPNSCRISKLLH